MKPPVIINGKYKIIDYLEAGSIAVVYSCLDTTQPDQQLAIKVLFPEFAKDPRGLSRLQHDFNALQKVSHQNVISVFDFMHDGDNIAYTMEWAEGGDLATWLQKSEQISTGDVVRILSEICSGVQAIHDLGMTHRNIKPENVLFTTQGNVKISDLCISCGRRGMPSSNDGVVGTIDWVPPEYMLNGEVDWRTDIYGVGLLGYKLLTNQSPFRGDSVYATITKRLKSDPVAPSVIRVDCSAALDAIILRAMHRDPEQRFQSANDILHALQNIANSI